MLCLSPDLVTISRGDDGRLCRITDRYYFFCRFIRAAQHHGGVKLHTDGRALALLYGLKEAAKIRSRPTLACYPSSSVVLRGLFLPATLVQHEEADDRNQTDDVPRCSTRIIPAIRASSL